MGLKEKEKSDVHLQDNGVQKLEILIVRFLTTQ